MLPEVVDELNGLIDKALEGVHTAMPGKITKFDLETGLASVKPDVQYKVDDETKLDYPEISSVPVVIPQSSEQGVTIAYPIKEGDGCLLIISEKSNDMWLFEQDTGMELSHDLSNAIAIVGLFNKPNKYLVEATKTDKAIIASGGTKMTIGGGSVNIIGNLVVSGSIKSGSKVTASESLNVGSTAISSGQISGNINVSGNVSAGGNVSGTNVSASNAVSGSSVTAGSVSLGSHTHPYSWGDSAGSGTTGAPS